MTVIDTPQGISHWFLLSAVSQLGLEIKTGRNFYGKRSVYSGLRQHGLLAPERPDRATKRNKMLALADILDAASDQGIDLGEVGRSARATLDAACAEMGVVISH